MKVAGILALITGVMFPMAMLGWLAFRMNRKPPLASRRMGVILALNGVLPIALILAGFGMLSPAFWAASWVRAAVIAAFFASAVLIVFLLASSRRVTARHGAEPGGPDG